MLQERCDCEDPPHPQQCTNHRIPTRARPQRTPTQYLPSSDLPAASVAGWDQAPLRRGELAESSKIRNFKNEKVGKEVRQQNRMLIHCMLGTLIACRRFSSIKKKKRKIMPGLMQGRAENYSFHSGFLDTHYKHQSGMEKHRFNSPTPPRNRKLDTAQNQE